MKITYDIYAGTPPYNVTLVSESLTYTNIHSGQGSFSFNDVQDGTYRLTSTDAEDCEFEFGQIIVDNNKIGLINSLTNQSENTQVINGITVQSKTKRHLMLMNPKLGNGASASITFGVSLITEENPSNSSDEIYGLASIEAFKDNVSVFQQQANSNTLLVGENEFTIPNITNSSKIEFTGSVVVRNNPLDSSGSSAFYEIFAIEMKINTIPVSIDTELFNINDNLAS